jgi:hypothetical protein
MLGWGDTHLQTRRSAVTAIPRSRHSRRAGPLRSRRRRARRLVVSSIAAADRREHRISPVTLSRRLPVTLTPWSSRRDPDTVASHTTHIMTPSRIWAV